MTLLATMPREGAALKLSRTIDDLIGARASVTGHEAALARVQENLAAARKQLTDAELAYHDALFELTGGRQPPTGPAVISVGEAAA